MREVEAQKRAEIAAVLEEGWAAQQGARVAALEEAHARALESRGAAHRAAWHMNEYGALEKVFRRAEGAALEQLSRERAAEAAVALTAEQRARAEWERSRHARAAAVRGVEDERAGILAEEQRERAAREAAAEERLEGAEAERERLGLPSLVDFRYSRLHRLGVPRVVQRHEGAGADGRGGDAAGLAREEQARGEELDAERGQVRASMTRVAGQRHEAAVYRERMAGMRREMERALREAAAQERRVGLALAQGAEARREDRGAHAGRLRRAFEAAFLGRGRGPAAGEGGPCAPGPAPRRGGGGEGGGGGGEGGGGGGGGQPVPRSARGVPTPVAGGQGAPGGAGPEAPAPAAEPPTPAAEGGTPPGGPQGSDSSGKSSISLAAEAPGSPGTGSGATDGSVSVSGMADGVSEVGEGACDVGDVAPGAGGGAGLGGPAADPPAWEEPSEGGQPDDLSALSSLGGAGAVDPLAALAESLTDADSLSDLDVSDADVRALREAATGLSLSSADLSASLSALGLTSDGRADSSLLGPLTLSTDPSAGIPSRAEQRRRRAGAAAPGSSGAGSSRDTRDTRDDDLGLDLDSTGVSLDSLDAPPAGGTMRHVSGFVRAALGDADADADAAVDTLLGGSPSLSSGPSSSSVSLSGLSSVPPPGAAGAAGGGDDLRARLAAVDETLRRVRAAGGAPAGDLSGPGSTLSALSARTGSSSAPSARDAARAPAPVARGNPDGTYASGALSVSELTDSALLSGDGDGDGTRAQARTGTVEDFRRLLASMEGRGGAGEGPADASASSDGAAWPTAALSLPAPGAPGGGSADASGGSPDASATDTSGGSAPRMPRKQWMAVLREHGLDLSSSSLSSQPSRRGGPAVLDDTDTDSDSGFGGGGGGLGGGAGAAGARPSESSASLGPADGDVTGTSDSSLGLSELLRTPAWGKGRSGVATVEQSPGDSGGTRDDDDEGRVQEVTPESRRAGLV